MFSSVHCPRAIRVLYITLVCSKLLHCSPIWRLHLLRDIKAIENVQRRATKFILNNYVSNDRLHLLDLPLKCLNEPSAHFNIFRFITFCSGQYMLLPETTSPVHSIHSAYNGEPLAIALTLKFRAKTCIGNNMKHNNVGELLAGRV